MTHDLIIDIIQDDVKHIQDLLLYSLLAHMFTLGLLIYLVVRKR